MRTKYIAAEAGLKRGAAPAKKEAQPGEGRPCRRRRCCCCCSLHCRAATNRYWQLVVAAPDRGALWLPSSMCLPPHPSHASALHGAEEEKRRRFGSVVWLPFRCWLSYTIHCEYTCRGEENEDPR